MTAWQAIRDGLMSTLADERRVDDLYLPVFRFIAGAHGRAPTQPTMVFVSGPQGSGKSTLGAYAIDALTTLGLRAVTLSIDDFYLTHQEQLALAARHPRNRYLEHRGYPGTHDVALGTATLRALAGGESRDVRLPGYDKGAFGGRGDRAPDSSFRSVRGPVDVVLLEGWMLGFEPVSEGAIDDVDLRVPNSFLDHYAAWTSRLDALVHLDTTELDAIVSWRIDAERARRRETGAGLSDAETRDYIERFLPAYRLWGPGLRARAHSNVPLLRVTLGPDRSPRACVEFVDTGREA